jgi:hypothetical protein
VYTHQCLYMGIKTLPVKLGCHVRGHVCQISALVDSLVGELRAAG